MPLLPPVTSRHGQITFEKPTVITLSVFSACCRCQNFPVMLSVASTRGSDVPIPHRSGLKARRRRVTATERTLELYIAGDVNPAGDTHGDVVEGLESNINEWVLLADPPATSAGTVDCTVTWPSGGDDTAPVHVLGFETGAMFGPGIIAATLDISIPGGRI